MKATPTFLPSQFEYLTRITPYDCSMRNAESNTDAFTVRIMYQNVYMSACNIVTAEQRLHLSPYFKNIGRHKIDTEIILSLSCNVKLISTLLT